MAKQDLVIIGGGPGGYVGAIRASRLGLSVTLVERERQLGGTCLLRGCIPTKALLHSADLLQEMRGADAHGIRAEGITVDFPGIMRNKKKVVDRSAAGVRYLMKKNGVEVVNGTARIDGPGSVSVSLPDQEEVCLEAREVLIATGSVPRGVPGIEPDGRHILTSNEMLELKEIPPSLLVLGGGAVGVEFASVFSRLGSVVTIVELLPRLLPFEDEEISDAFAKALGKRGIRTYCGTRMGRVTATEDGVVCAVEDGDGGTKNLSASMLLSAVGRAPFTEGLGAVKAGVCLDDRGFVKVDDHYRTTVPGIRAIGDVIDTPALAHVASAEAIAAVEHIAGAETHPVDYATTPSCTYADPEVASVGLTEAAARDAGHEVSVGRFPFSASGKARILGATDGFVKIVAGKPHGEVLGVHIMGPHATELIAEAGILLRTECTAEEIVRTMHPHPTLSEAIQEAAHGVDGNPLHI
ncbi:MAG: dihydrolipoyl dehydrogenase [Gemmatimonadota bacterium]|nr:dihydrolipoyl dehydrogenase [Gemmatimonadota bacterium]MDP6529703.1 dihydrolipoyl dehydrogenase [Gemmatimonadota bacterium]MDP6802490.1 dihydrolipoyl dehydrogenase [Gemmatimonadota bacterium]MDP7030953.1 dihydrolipoyl dehydrogenase [Gemmatimonadota bacterium]